MDDPTDSLLRDASRVRHQMMVVEGLLYRIEQLIREADAVLLSAAVAVPTDHSAHTRRPRTHERRY